jgi:hypothetical protein
MKIVDMDVTFQIELVLIDYELYNSTYNLKNNQ